MVFFYFHRTWNFMTYFHQQNKNMAYKFPSLFINHGAPNLILDKNHKTTIFLRNYQSQSTHPKPKAILIVSAHWEEKEFSITTKERVSPIYDFYGFEDELYRMDYSPKTSPELINRLDTLFKQQNIKLLHDKNRGIDHGVWTILKMMYPNADIPVVQLSLHDSLDGELHYRIGKLLQPLRDEEILIISSGSTMHNLRLLFSSAGRQPDHPVKHFEHWVQQTLTDPSIKDEEERLKQLLKFRSAPQFKVAHPREEHFIPLMVGAGTGNCKAAQLIHLEWSIPTFVHSFFQWT